MANTIYLVYGYRSEKEGKLHGHVPSRHVHLSVHKSFTNAMAKMAEYNEKITDYKDPNKASWTYNWDFDYVDYEVLTLEE